MIFDKFVVKKNKSFFIDLNEIDFDITFEFGDLIKFKYDGIIYLGKIDLKVEDDVFLIKVVKEII